MRTSIKTSLSNLKVFQLQANNLTRLNYMSQLWERTTCPKRSSTCSRRGWRNLLPQSKPKRYRCNNSCMGCLLARSAQARLPILRWLMKKGSFKAILIYLMRLISREKFHHRLLEKIKNLMSCTSIWLLSIQTCWFPASRKINKWKSLRMNTWTAAQKNSRGFWIIVWSRRH